MEGLVDIKLKIDSWSINQKDNFAKNGASMRDDRNDCPTYVPRILGMCHMGDTVKGLVTLKLLLIFVGGFSGEGVGVSPLAKQTCSLFLLDGVSVGHG